MKVKRTIAGLTTAMLLGSMIAGYGVTASADSTVHMDNNPYDTIDAALKQANLDMAGKSKQNKEIILSGDQVMTGSGYAFGYSNTVTIKSDNGELRTLTFSPTVDAATPFAWDWYVFDGIKLTQDTANPNTIYSVFPFPVGESSKYYKNNEVTFKNSEITGITASDCISVFATNNLYNTKVYGNTANATLFANRDECFIVGSTITENTTTTIGTVQVSENTTTIKDSVIKDNNFNGHGDLQIEGKATAILSGSTEIGVINNSGTLILASDFNGKASINSATEVGTVLATVQDGADVSGITVNDLADNLMLKVEGGQLVIAEKPASSVTPNAEVKKVTDNTTESDSDAVGFVGNVKVTGTANIGFTVTATNNEQKTATKDWIYDTVITSNEGESTDVVFGLMITDLSRIGLTRDNVSAEYLK